MQALWRIFGLLIVLWAAMSVLNADDTIRADDAIPVSVRAFLERHCIECHHSDSGQSELSLMPLVEGSGSLALQLDVLDKIETGEMPPKTNVKPSRQEIREAADWLVNNISKQRRATEASEGRVVLRRLNRVEYENTLRDLLGVSIRVRDILPSDSSAAGFDNVGEALHVSSFLLERYFEAAERSLDQAIASSNRPTAKSERVTLDAAYQVKQNSEKVFRHGENGRVTMLSSSAWQSATLFWLEQPGRFRFRIAVQAEQNGKKPVVFSAHITGGSHAAQPELVGYFDAPADSPRVIEFESQMEPGMSLTIRPYGLASSNEIVKAGPETWAGPGLAVDWVEMQGPLNDVWPPVSHSRLFGELTQMPIHLPSGMIRYEVVPNDVIADTHRIISRFARRAFRHPVSDEELLPWINLVSKRRSEGASFEQSVRVGLAAVMTSPEFLFLREVPGRLDDFAIASRLSYFLWSSMPDEELLTMAENGKLHEPDTLYAQVERMLKSTKSSAFTENFTGQWLRLREIDFTEPSMQLYPEFDDMLKVSMVREVQLFFDELLRENHSLSHFLASDFSVINGRLAKHYGVPGVDGWSFRKVIMPRDSHRGGLMTMAAVLKVTANGTSTSPVLRGAWVLDRILGTPSKPPPANVGSVEPDTRGATTIREQLRKHRDIEACASCHAKIDPPGFALESFDVIGGWRDFYRSTGNGIPVDIEGRRMHYLQGPAVDPSYELADGRKFANVDELKQLLLDDVERFARAITIRLLTYGTGGTIDATNQREVSMILEKTKAKDWGFRTLIHEVVQSPLFLEK